MTAREQTQDWTGLEIAIVGMSGRFPGAPDIDAYWQLLQNGIEAITRFSDGEMVADGVDPYLMSLPNYVKAAAVLDQIEHFDAEFFAYNPKEAALLDPQQRIFLETAWQALETAGYNPDTYKGAIGVYGGVGPSTYLLHAFADANLSQFMALIANDKDFLTTRVSYKLNLRGPSIDVQTACSTSLVAVHLACQGLLSGECDMALAGGVAIKVPHKAGYLYQEGHILSPDGHCRPFDAQAHGTIVGNGVGIVVLKRLEDALADGDTIDAIIKGTAINNDGSEKVGYTAPSVNGQAAVIRAAQMVAEVEPESIGYIEAHGTGTVLGDPIELAALNQVFRAHTEERHFCGIGSVKSNFGHLDTAAGIAGLIKTALTLKHAAIPPSLHFEAPNPQIDFAHSPFYVNANLTPWPVQETKRRAAVSSFGIGGTNAHAILEEAPATEPSGPSRPWQLLTFSARTMTALETTTANVTEVLQQQPDLNLADVAYTLQQGRKAFAYRCAVVCRDQQDAVAALAPVDYQRVLTSTQPAISRSVVFMFPGQGAQYVQMGCGLYATEAVFREYVDTCAETLQPHIGLDLRNMLFADDEATATTRLTQTALTQPALFTIEYALAQLWISWGIRPQAMIGHSIGEYVAACLAGVIALDDALMLVAARGRLMQELPGGAMISVSLPESQVLPFLSESLTIAAVNAPDFCVIAGPTEAIECCTQVLSEQNIKYQTLHTSHAFHSSMMDAIIEPYTQLVRQLHLHPPQIPYLSNVTGTWITAIEATDPIYWAYHLRQTVRFSEGINTLLQESGRVFLEVGPGRTLGTLVRQAAAQTDGVVLSSLRHPRDIIDDEAFLLETLGRLWIAGVQPDWTAFSADEERRRVRLPSYPFERQRYWIDQPEQLFATHQTPISTHEKRPLKDWLYTTQWERTTAPANTQPDQAPQRWLVFGFEHPLIAAVTTQLRETVHDLLLVVPGAHFTMQEDGSYTIDPTCPDDYAMLVEQLTTRGWYVDRVVHLWSLFPKETDALVDYGINSVIALMRALELHSPNHTATIEVVTSQAQDVTGSEVLVPEKALLDGLCNVIPQEYPHITCRSIDVPQVVAATWQTVVLAAHLVDELTTQTPTNTAVAYRGTQRWERTVAPLCLSDSSHARLFLHEDSVYLIANGFSGFGQALTSTLAQTIRATFVLTTPSAFPDRSNWNDWLAAHHHDDTTSQYIRFLREVEQSDTHVAVVETTLIDEAVFSQIASRFGAVRGVFYTLAETNESAFRSIGELNDGATKQFENYRDGLQALLHNLPQTGVDFCILQSSLAAVLGGVGLAHHAALATFTNAWVQECNRSSHVPWIAVGWDQWRVEADQHGVLGQTDVAITPSEGVRIIEHILAQGVAGPVLISTADLLARLNERRQNEQATTRGAMPTPHERPHLLTPYVAPRNEIEQIIADIWQTLLGIDQVGVYDNFFELGGHSLLITQVVSHIREALVIDLPLRRLFDTQTIAELAVVLVQELAELEDSESLSAILSEIEQLSTDDTVAELSGHS
ncbi:MAG: type I polyketide synthase [Chloroflexi bacterium AL-W]|nr:type I polyketide synthase [Chloroflexi bacterium AL-N1]NOK64604.1 type I polyketide synthase [Chloroflexi bacterium AL-N10]NOK75845.1 type I polyketide synthase [Chloroflexi bacterium AL-N5]NOK80396.1 type I polyketide synthase [Chloroflexi bacterium AL-W]NOK86910.1 type I polyketide synthase [Chloroflexi bacterium AL-N15]